jgi:hypothetical protein
MLKCLAETRMSGGTSQLNTVQLLPRAIHLVASYLIIGASIRIVRVSLRCKGVNRIKFAMITTNYVGTEHVIGSSIDAIWRASASILNHSVMILSMSVYGLTSVSTFATSAARDYAKMIFGVGVNAWISVFPSSVK